MEAQKPEEMKRFHTEKWISTLVPAPKRSTLGVVAALDSVVGLCAGIESNISKDKDTQLYVHSDSKSRAFTKMSQEERGGAERATFWLLSRYAAVCLDQMQNQTIQRLKGIISNFQRAIYSICSFHPEFDESFTFSESWWGANCAVKRNTPI